MPNVPRPYEVNCKLVTGNGSLTPGNLFLIKTFFITKFDCTCNILTNFEYLWPISGSLNHCAASAFHQVRCGIHQRTKAYFPPLDGPRNESTEYTIYVFMLTEVLMFVA